MPSGLSCSWGLKNIILSPPVFFPKHLSSELEVLHFVVTMANHNVPLCDCYTTYLNGDIDQPLTKLATTVLIGALSCFVPTTLARTGGAFVPVPGGCNVFISKRKHKSEVTIIKVYVRRYVYTHHDSPVLITFLHKALYHRILAR